jgi:hypothetical protein
LHVECWSFFFLFCLYFSTFYSLVLDVTHARQRQGVVCVVEFAEVFVVVLTIFSCIFQAHMDGNVEPHSPQPLPEFRVGDTVHVYHGTSAGVRAHQTVAYIGTVVGYHDEERKWLVRNNMAKKGQPNRVDAAFMSRYANPSPNTLLS